MKVCCRILIIAATEIRQFLIHWSRCLSRQHQIVRSIEGNRIEHAIYLVPKYDVCNKKQKQKKAKN